MIKIHMKVVFAVFKANKITKLKQQFKEQVSAILFKFLYLVLKVQSLLILQVKETMMDMVLASMELISLLIVRLLM
jgi:hypothetical protein